MSGTNTAWFVFWDGGPPGQPYYEAQTLKRLGGSKCFAGCLGSRKFPTVHLWPTRKCLTLMLFSLLSDGTKGRSSPCALAEATSQAKCGSWERGPWADPPRSTPALWSLLHGDAAAPCWGDGCRSPPRRPAMVRSEMRLRKRPWQSTSPRTIPAGFSGRWTAPASGWLWLPRVTASQPPPALTGDPELPSPLQPWMLSAADSQPLVDSAAHDPLPAPAPGEEVQWL